jgi:hypothetical protein
MTEKKRAAELLAHEHFRMEPAITQIFTYWGKPGSEASGPIRLLEVDEDTVPTGVMPLHFGPAPEIGVPFPSVIIAVTPDEFRRIEARELPLPDGWEGREELPKPTNGDA